MPALRWIPVIVAPLVELLLDSIKNARNKKLAKEAAAFGTEYTAALLAGDDQKMKEVHVKALIHAKYVAIDALDPKLR